MNILKTFPLSAMIVIVALSLSPVLAENPIIRQKYTADPNAIVWNDRVYVYCSNDDNNPSTSGYDITAYTLMSSDDMANWTDHGEVFRVPRDLTGFNQAYAPGAAVKGGKVYLYIPNGGASIGVAVADRPEGPFTGGKQFITKTGSGTSGNSNVPWLFDPAGFVDDDGQGYIYFGGGPADGNPGPGQNLRGAKLNADMMSVQFPATTISGSTCSFEAAHLHGLADVAPRQINRCRALERERDVRLVRRDKRLHHAEHLAAREKVRFKLVGRNVDTRLHRRNLGLHDEFRRHLAEAHEDDAQKPDPRAGKYRLQPKLHGRADKIKENKRADCENGDNEYYVSGEPAHKYTVLCLWLFSYS